MKFADRAIELLNVEGNMDGNFKFLANRKTSFQAGVDSVYYSGPYWDHREIEAAIRSLLDGKWLTSGENVMKFEKSFSKRFGFSESVMVNSGSSANLVMLAALKKYFDWQDGDEIIVSAVGFPTTINPIIQNGLKPIFIDIDWADLNWDLEKLKFAITSRTRAVFSSPVLGNPYDFDKLLNILEGKEIKIISDNCDSLGSRWRGKFLTDYSIAASCSFYPAHHITTMEGGMISSIDEEIVKLARSFAWWGRACYCVGVQNLLPNGTCKKRFSNWIEDCEVIVDHKYVFENIGFNLKPLALQGAVGVVQLEKFEEIHQMRRKNKELIAHAFERINGVKVLDELTHSETSWFGVPIVCSNSHLKTKLVQFLEENKIQTRNYFAGNILQQPAYRELGNYNSFPNANRVLSEVFFVGCSPTFTDDMLNYVESTLAKFAI